MNNMNEIEEFQFLVRLLKLVDEIKRISFYADQSRKRFPIPEAMTRKEIQDLVKLYMALGFDIESIHEEWKELYGQYTK